jgi:transketolase
MELLNKDLRKRILEKGFEINSAHFSSALSCLDSIKYLYDEVLKEDDIFILSKGHGEMALYAVLETKGKKPPWTPHLDYNEKLGIYATTGSLGHGLPIGLGRAFAKKISNEAGKIYVLASDGEMEEGSNWEALSLASKLKINNLNLLIDWNKYQAVGSVLEVGGIDDNSLKRRIGAFDWKVLKINGHCEKGLSKLKYLKKGLNAIILDTIKGKGVKCLEESHAHGYKWSDKEKKESLERLK